MHGTALSAFDVQHNGTPCFSASIYLHTDTSFLQKKSMGSKIKNRWNKNNVNM